MASDPKVWLTGELITAEDLNRLEQAVDATDAALDGKVDDDDSRLTDARTPTEHRHALADVDGLTARLAALEYNSGRRDVSSLIAGATGVYLHRVGQVVMWDWVSATFPAGAWRVLCTVPVGFRPISEVLAVAHGASSLSALDGTRSSVRITTTLTAEVTAGPRYRLQVSYFTADPIPATLPGTPT